MRKSRKYVLEFPAYFKPTTRNHPAYSQWASMVSRCENPKATKYPDYGGLGISVCKRWRRGENGLSGFECFMRDMGNKPTRKHSLDRKNNNGNYCKANCKWSTNKEQCNNRRSNRVLTYKGESMSMLMLAEKVGMSYFVLRNRVSRGWAVEDAVEKPTGWFKFRRVARGEDRSDLIESQVLEIRAAHAAGAETMAAIGKRFYISTPNVWMIVHRKTWKHLR